MPEEKTGTKLKILRKSRIQTIPSPGVKEEITSVLVKIGDHFPTTFYFKPGEYSEDALTERARKWLADFMKEEFKELTL